MAKKISKKAAKKTGKRKAKVQPRAKAKAKPMSEEEQMTLDDLLTSVGFEGATASSYAMPFLRVLQKLSPEVDKDDSQYIEGAEPGMIIHTITKDLYNEVSIVPLQYKDSYIEWIPRSSGGGFVRELEFPSRMTSEILATCTKEENKNILPNGNELKLHSSYFCAMEGEDEEFTPVLISMSASQLKTSRNWMSQMQTMKIEHEGKMYPAKNIRSYKWTLATEKLENDKGKWYGWTVEAEENTLHLPQLGGLQENVRQAVTSNLLTYDRDQQGGEADSGNAL